MHSFSRGKLSTCVAFASLRMQVVKMSDQIYDMSALALCDVSYMVQPAHVAYRYRCWCTDVRISPAVSNSVLL